MKLLNASAIIENLEPRDVILTRLENAARTCYKSEDKAKEGSASKLVRDLCQIRKHESVLEHAGATIRFIVDRGVSHELVRHRIASFSQESTRYVNYGGPKTGGHCQFIIPGWMQDIVKPGEYTFADTHTILSLVQNTPKEAYAGWFISMIQAEENYLALLKLGWSPQQARSVLPNSTKTEVVMTANLREWRHVFALRCSANAHPQMQEVMRPLLSQLQAHLPELFDDITY